MSTSPHARAYFLRRDDSGEKVFVTGMDRTPNGYTYFEFVLPEHHKGRKDQLTHREFEKAYKSAHEPKPEPPKKPVSTGSAAEWRAWALKLESDLANAERQLERARRDNPNWW